MQIFCVEWCGVVQIVVCFGVWIQKHGFQVLCRFRDHHRRSVGLLWAFCGFQIPFGLVNISRTLTPISGLYKGGLNQS